MSEIFEKKKIKLTTKSPIHIGSVEQRLTPFEYVHYGHYVYQISDEKLSIVLQKKNLIESYINAVNRDRHRFRLMDFFKENKIALSEEDLNTISGNKKTQVLEDASKLQDYNPFIRDGIGNIYIPGTSLKGFIRTAVFYVALKILKKQDNRRFQNGIIKRIESTEPRFFKRRNAFERLQMEYLENFKLSNKTRSPNTDWLKMLHIRDGYPKNLTDTNLLPVNILKKESTGWRYKKEYSGQNTTIWVETVPQDTTFEFDMLWDRTLCETFKSENPHASLPMNIDDIISNINEFSNDILDFEANFTKEHILGQWYKNATANFRIGFGSGMISTTIAMLLPEETRKKIRNYSGRNKGDDIAPKSRRVWIKNSQIVPLGWALMEIMP